MIWVGEGYNCENAREDPGNCNPLNLHHGFPNETEEEFNALYDFLTEMKFDRVGVFPYYLEEGTPSAEYGDTVPDEVKTRRVDLLMKHQQEISHEINRSFIGKTWMC